LPEQHLKTTLFERLPRVIHVGDLFFNKIYPFVDLDNGGSFDGFIAAQRRVIDMAKDDTVLIAGHGPSGNKAEMQVAVDLMLAIRDTMQPLIDKGMSMEEVLEANPLSVFEKFAWFHITTERMTKIVYYLLTEG
jgi:glyoxylase-like metal-dependent hydrolase (beta-lactamase superfamily II)